MFAKKNPTLGQVAQIDETPFEWDGWTWSRRDNAPAPRPSRKLTPCRRRGRKQAMDRPLEHAGIRLEVAAALGSEAASTMQRVKDETADTPRTAVDA
jgi:hypothetical protein